MGSEAVKALKLLHILLIAFRNFFCSDSNLKAYYLLSVHST